MANFLLGSTGEGVKPEFYFKLLLFDTIILSEFFNFYGFNLWIYCGFYFGISLACLIIFANVNNTGEIQGVNSIIF